MLRKSPNMGTDSFFVVLEPKCKSAGDCFNRTTRILKDSEEIDGRGN